MTQSPQPTSSDHIEYNRKTGKVQAWVGPAAVDVARVRMLASSIRLHGSTGMIPTRGITITKMMKMATEYTGKKYRLKDHDAAFQDLMNLASVRMADLPAVEV